MTIHNDQIDLVAKSEDLIEVEFQEDMGRKDRVKLYIHWNGQTILRVGNLSQDQITLKLEPVI